MPDYEEDPRKDHPYESDRLPDAPAVGYTLGCVIVSLVVSILIVIAIIMAIIRSVMS